MKINGVEYPELKPCPACGKAAEYPYSVTFVGEFYCDHCGAYHPGDCGVVRPGYFRDEDGVRVHYMTETERMSYHFALNLFYDVCGTTARPLFKTVVLP